jgi:hypothetical protein
MARNVGDTNLSARERVMKAEAEQLKAKIALEKAKQKVQAAKLHAMKEKMAK